MKNIIEIGLAEGRNGESVMVYKENDKLYIKLYSDYIKYIED